MDVNPGGGGLRHAENNDGGDPYRCRHVCVASSQNESDDPGQRADAYQHSSSQPFVFGGQVGQEGAHGAAQRGAGQGGGLLLRRGVCLRRRGGYRRLLGEQVGDGYLIAVADIKDLLHLRVAPSRLP